VAADVSALVLVAALYFIVVHGPKGDEIDINASEIASIHAPREDSLLNEHVSCVIFMSDRRFISVRETCMEVIEMIAKLKEKPP
jgi:hypothetical protein